MRWIAIGGSSTSTALPSTSGPGSVTNCWVATSTPCGRNYTAPNCIAALQAALDDWHQPPARSDGSRSPARRSNSHVVASGNGAAVYFRDVSAQRRMEREFRERSEALTFAERSAGIGVWDVDIATEMLRGTAQFFRIMGLEPTTEPVSIETDAAATLSGRPRAGCPGIPRHHRQGRQRLRSGIPHPSPGRPDTLDLRAADT